MCEEEFCKWSKKKCQGDKVELCACLTKNEGIWGCLGLSDVVWGWQKRNMNVFLIIAIMYGEGKHRVFVCKKWQVEFKTNLIGIYNDLWLTYDLIISKMGKKGRNIKTKICRSLLRILANCFESLKYLQDAFSKKRDSPDLSTKE